MLESFSASNRSVIQGGCSGEGGPQGWRFTALPPCAEPGVRCLERVFLLESSMPVLLGCGPMWSQLQEGRWFLRSSRKLRFYVKPFHFKMLAS